MNEKEVDLRDYIKLMFGNKKLILGIFLLGTIVAVGFNFIFIPKEKIYEGRTLLEIGYENKKSLIEEPEQLMEKIKSGVYGEYSDGEIIALNPLKTNLIEIIIKGGNQEKIKSILEKINDAILNTHNEKLNIKKEILVNEIIGIQSKINLLEQEEKNMKLEITSTQQLIFFLLKNDLKAEEQQINDIKEKLADIQLTNIVLFPKVSEKSLIQKSLFNIVAGGLTGLFTGIFIAFLLAWWKKPVKMT